MLTNRTMLWKYYDGETCSLYGSCCARFPCLDANVREVCDPILQRASWIPSYDEWHERLHLPEPLELPYYTTHPPEMSDQPLPWGPGNDESVQGIDVLQKDTILVAFPQMRYKATWMANETMANTLLHSHWSRTLNRELHSLGSNFLHGMLLEHSMQLTDQIRASSIPPEAHPFYERRDGLHTIALHSRHHFDTQHGCDIAQEQTCLKDILKTLRQQSPRQRDDTGPTCVVSLMADRICTIERLQGWIQQELGCQVFVASREEAVQYNIRIEHGPFAGAGFFQDWALASMARSAFVGTNRSSSDLVLELIAYRRVMEAWEAGQHHDGRLSSSLLSSSVVPTCLLHFSTAPSMNVTGHVAPSRWTPYLNANGTVQRKVKVHTPTMVGPDGGLAVENLTIASRVSCDDPQLRVTVFPEEVQGPRGSIFELNETVEMVGCTNGTCHVSFVDVASGTEIGSPQSVVVGGCTTPFWKLGLTKKCYTQVVMGCQCPFQRQCAIATVRQCRPFRKMDAPKVLAQYRHFCSWQSNVTTTITTTGAV